MTLFVLRNFHVNVAYRAAVLSAKWVIRAGPPKKSMTPIFPVTLARRLRGWDPSPRGSPGQFATDWNEKKTCWEFWKHQSVNPGNLVLKLYSCLVSGFNFWDTLFSPPSYEPPPLQITQ